MMHSSQLSFNSGEVGENYLLYRNDFSKNAAALAEMRNMIPLPFGVATKRPGTTWLSKMKHGGANSKAFTFQASDKTRYVLHFTPGFLSIYREDGTLAAELPFMGSINWAAVAEDEQLRFMQMENRNDVAFFVHPLFHPLRLTTVSDVQWSLEFAPFDRMPVNDPNTETRNTWTIYSTDYAPNWQAGVYYAPGTHVTWQPPYATEYTCVFGHTSNGSNYPAADVQLNNSVWVRRLYLPGHKVSFSAQHQFANDPTGPKWQPGTSYSVNALVSQEGVGYICKQTHVSSGKTQPGYGGEWREKWEFRKGYFEPFELDERLPGLGIKVSMTHYTTNFIQVSATQLNNTLYSPWQVVDSEWAFNTFGTWHGTFALLVSFDGGKTEETHRVYRANGERNFAETGDFGQVVLMRLRFYAVPATDTGGPQRAILTATRLEVTGHMLALNRYSNGGYLECVVTTPMLSGVTALFAVGAWSVERGFPRAIALHDARMVFGGTTQEPTGLWLSRSDDYLNFEESLLDDSAIHRNLAAGSQHAIRWLYSWRRLFIGTMTGEWVVGSETNDSSITPTDFIVRQYSPTGSAPHQPILGSGGLFFLGRNGSRLYELTESEITGNFNAVDLSRLAEHLSAEGLRSFAYQQTREPMFWFTTGIGSLLSFSYSKQEEIAAWAKHTTEGFFRDVMVFPADEGDDLLFFVVERNQPGQPPETHLEKFVPGWQASMEAGTPLVALDSKTLATFAGGYALAENHHEGLEVAVVPVAGGVTRMDVVTGGAPSALIASGRDIGPVWVGFPVRSRLKTLPLDVASENGTTQGRRKRANELLLNLYKSQDGVVEYDGQSASISYLDNTLFSGWVGTTLSPAHVDDLQISISHDAATSFTVRGLVLRWQIHEP